MLWHPSVGLSSPSTNFVMAAGVQGVLWDGFSEIGVLGDASTLNLTRFWGLSCCALGKVWFSDGFAS